jgi:hypothetical protein
MDHFRICQETLFTGVEAEIYHKVSVEEEKSTYCPHHFKLVVERFRNHNIATAQRSGCPTSKTTPEAKQ